MSSNRLSLIKRSYLFWHFEAAVFQHRTQGYSFLVLLEALVAEHGFMWLLCVVI